VFDRQGHSMVSTGSVVARRQLGRELRGLREASGRTREDVTGPHLGIASLAKLSRIERGQIAVRPGDVRELCSLYGADAESTERLVELARGTKAEEWWEPFGIRAPRWFAMYLSLEQVAERIQTFEPVLIHGLFQTRMYAQEVETKTASEPDAPIDTYVATRLRRQEKILRRPRPPRIELILGETALRVECENPAIMPMQLAHLRQLATWESIDVRVLPLRKSLNVGAHGKFSILDFPDAQDPPTVYLEQYGSARYPEDPAQVASFRRRFDVLRDLSVPIEELDL
jgi:transcriptional regulator with XRE-family HTH domain